MAGISEVYPTDAALPAIVRGDPLVIPVTFADEADVTGWTFRAHVRSYPDGALIATAGITTAGNVVSLGFTPEQTALFTGSEGFDLEQLTPVRRTWWIVKHLRVEKDYSHV